MHIGVPDGYDSIILEEWNAASLNNKVIDSYVFELRPVNPYLNFLASRGIIVAWQALTLHLT